jgi:hypothetical protein
MKKIIIIITALLLTLSCSKENPQPTALLQEPAPSKVYLIETYGARFNRTKFNDTIVYFSADRTYQTTRTLFEGDSLRIAVESDINSNVKINIYYNGLILHQRQALVKTNFILYY